MRMLEIKVITITRIRDLFVYKVRKLKVYTRRNFSSKKKKSLGLKTKGHTVCMGEYSKLCIVI